MSTKPIKRPNYYSAQGANVGRNQQATIETLYPEIQLKRDAAIDRCRAEADKFPVLVSRNTWKLIDKADLHLWLKDADGFHHKAAKQ